MKTVVFVALFVALFAYAQAAATFTIDGSTAITNSYASTRHQGADPQNAFTALFTVNVACDNANFENCTAGGGTWTIPNGITGVSIDTTTDPDQVKVDPSANPPEKFKITFTALNNTNGGASLVHDIIIFVTDATVYNGAPSLSTSWVATLITNTPARNLQWTPSADPSFDGSSPYNFVRPVQPNPSVAVPLYWGNFYEIRLGLAESNGRYCGTNGTWPDQTNDDDVPPTPSSNGWNPKGCANFLENGDTWTFPAPSQRIPRAGSNGYDTQRPQSAANPIAAVNGATTSFGPLVWSVRGGSGSALKFAALALPGNWVSTCVDAINGATNPSFPCIAPRFNPDPQVWVVSATGTQPARITAVGTSSVTAPFITALNHQATPPIDVADIKNTNEFLVTFEWPNIQTAVTGDAAAGIPVQPIVINRPTCGPSGTFVADDPANPVASNVKGINWFPTCEQGLQTSSCTAGGTVTNCLNATFAANDADTLVGNLLGQTALSGVWLSQRPLQILPNGASAAVLNSGNGAATSVPLTFDARQGTLPFTIGFPLDVAQSGSTGNAIVDNYWNFGANGTTNPGVVTIKPKLVIECANTGDCLSTAGGTSNYVAGSLTDFFGATLPTLTVSNANPSATVAFSSLPQPTQGNTWVMFFEVQDSATSATVYPYTSIPYLVITLTDIDITFVNFPPGDGNLFITQPQANAPNSYNYQVRIKRSPRSLGLASITLGWTITGATAPVTFLVNGTAVTSFVFSEYQTVINFQIFTTGSPVGPFTITWTDPLAANGGNSFLTIPAPSTNLFVRANPISPKTVASRTSGPFVGEPFWVELTWSPPAVGAFTVTASGASIAEGTASVTAAAGDTGMVLGPLTPILPSNIDLSAPSFQLPISLRTDSTAYSIVSVVTVNVFRHSLVVTNAIDDGNTQNNTLFLFTNGEPSQQYCISTNYPVFNSSLVTAADSLTITLASDSDPNVPGLIFTPTVVVLNSATPRSCVTIKADRNFNWDSLGGSTVGYAVSAYLGGSLAGMFQNPTGAGINNPENIWDFPHTVIVNRLDESLTIDLDQSRLTGASGVYALGETVQLRVYTDVLPVGGLNYTIRAPGGVTIVPSTAGSSSTTSHGRFAPATAGAPGQWQAWDVTFTGFAGDSETTSTFARQATLSLYVSSGDAEFYRWTAPNALLGTVADVQTVTIVKRGVSLSTFGNGVVQLMSLVGGSASGTVVLDHPVVNGLTVSLSAVTTNGVQSGGLSFSPANVTFTPGGPNSQAFTVSGNLLGTFMIRASLSGPDVDWFDLNNGATPRLIQVVKRLGPVLGSAAGSTFSSEGTVYAGLTYGPIAVDFPAPLNLGESVTITPTGSDFTFTPASVTLTAGQSQALFSFVFKSATQVDQAVVFWQFSGPDAWKYNYVFGGSTIRQNFTINYLSWNVNYGTGNVIPGVTHEGWVTLPFPVTSDLTITPFVLGASITFNPAVWAFTPATGNTLHFTYTVNGAQAFALSSSGVNTGDAKRNFFQPEVSNVGIRVVYLVNGTDAAVYAGAGTDSLALSRPAFKLDATYQQNSVVQNAAEQTLTNDYSKSTNLFVVGKWSQWYSVHLATPPAAGSVTLTITDSQNVVHFQVGSDPTETTSATLTFTADSYAHQFRFRFVKVLAVDSTANGIARLSVSVSGTNAAWYDYTELFNAFSGIQVVPPLAFSPIPAIYTDGHADGLFVALKNPDGAFGAWPFADDAQFTLHIFPSLKSGVVVEPSTLEFSKSQANAPVQGFSIRHTNPRVFGGQRSYTLTYALRFAGQTGTVDITAIVPQDAQNVLLSRHQIIPKFPHVLSYGWQKASFNLSHIPLAHVSFIPRLPPVDGNWAVRGATTPAGRVDFEPAVIVAAPGQQVVEFQVKAQPGVDRENLYYRVDWEVIGHADDTVNWVESLQRGATGLGNNDAPIYFATWHLASAGVAQVSLVVMFVACIFVAVMNFN